ncbi:UDP-N-acetylmuramoyl-L-alanyl-D-glutamate--2,6-diaminopimelate ligase [Nocardioides sp. JQ2195]|uniref:UDP-N-acetylmuramoyl-L-alanyl-D-glutamate--2, 6-diaminopimelate ligase n=1 Tax=Nocardioides sp. JQ2195 TaxID=2592334 RepID=UPI003211CB0B
MADWLGVESPAGDPEVTGITLSSHRVLPGDLYVGLAGARAHGASYALAAVEAGAVAVLTDSAGGGLTAGLGIPVMVVDDLRPRLGRLAARLHGHPTEHMRMIAVTGTQGKTTTTRLAEEALAGARVHAAVIGTVGTRVDGEDIPTTLTTPEAPDLHGLFAMMLERGVQACAMEVSSHALVMGRVDGVVFDVAVFTNLGRDHLDFHKDVEHYFAAKASLFTPERARLGLVNVDDEFGRRLLAEASIPMRTFALHDSTADWHVTDVDLAPDGSAFTVVGPGGVQVRTSVPIPGDFNVANALSAIAACAEAGYDVEAVAGSLARGSGVPGRLEQVPVPGGFSVVVDYAHKPDAVEAALTTLRPLTDGRLVVVIGAGGDRDTGKRPVMGEIAARLADLVIVTDDNPRTEDPGAIRAEVLAGARGGHAEVIEVGNRRDAIREALARASFGDIVLVAGKGHETGQEVDGVVHPFDDRVVVREEAAR